VGRRLVVAIVAAAAAGTVVGLAARLLMRAVALAAHGTSHFTWTGTVIIVVVFAGAMLPGAMLAALARRRRWLLLTTGAVFLLIPATGIATDEVGDTAGWSAGRWIGVGLAGLGVYLLIAALPMITLRLTDVLLVHSRLAPR
jgi:hypothetical protein